MDNNKETKLILTIDQQEKLIKMLEEEKQNVGKIEIPLEENKNYKTTIRANEKVWKKFNTYCKKKKDFSQKDHLSRALISYMENNK